MTRSLIAAVAITIACIAPARAAPAPWTARDVQRLRADVKQALSSPVLRGAHIGLLIEQTTGGRVLYSRNADDEFQPASNFKLLVGSVALDRLMLVHSFLTTVWTAVKIHDGMSVSEVNLHDGTLTGDLFLSGGGDAHLTARDLDAAAKAVVDAGIVHVTGSVTTVANFYDARRFPQGWDWDDLPYYYAPVVSALSLEENTVHVYISPGERVGTPVRLRIVPQSAAFTIDNRATTGAQTSTDTTDVERPWDEPRTIRIVGSYPVGAKESDDLRPAVPDPEAYVGDVFLRALNAHGVTVSGGLQTGGRLPASSRSLWIHESDQMPRLLAQLWQPSDNLMGELLLKDLGDARDGMPGTTDHGAALERDWLRSIGVDPQTVSISDGSGLSNYDRITPRALVAILQHDWNGKYRAIVLNALPVAGVSGTLKDAYRGTAAEKNVIAKTGTISHVRTLSGYIRTRRHGMVTFSFLINDWVQDDAPHGAESLAKLRGALLSKIVTN
jgi:serine-type D-Ala-D-Ala carboxypeptidase/endopeptidase (penicillin-binding protein 4)